MAWDDTKEENDDFLSDDWNNMVADQKGRTKVFSGTGTPVGSVTPEKIGDLYVDTDTDKVYNSVGLTSADWTSSDDPFDQDLNTTDSVSFQKVTVTSDGLDITGDIIVSGTVDGIDIATDVAANTLKVSNVTTNLSEGTVTETTVDVNSSDGTNATLASASTTRAGLLTKEKFDEIVANTAKVSFNWDYDYNDLINTPSIPTQYTDEMAQDAVGGMVDATLTYTDGTPELKVTNPVNTELVGFTITAGTTAKTLTVPLDASVSGTNTGDQDISGIATNAGAITNIKAKTDFISVTQAVDLDTMESDIATNNSKVSNATHTGEVTGSGALTVDKTAITGKTEVTAVGTDYFLLSDTSDTGNLKKALISDLLSGAGYTNLTQFVDQTAWRVFYSNADGDVTELALGADGTFLKSNGATSAPTFAVPTGSGDVSKVGTPVDNQVGVWTGDGTIEGTTGLTYDGTSFSITGNIIVSGTVDGHDINSEMTANNAKVTNANHSGDATGDTALTLANAAITGKTTVTADSADYVLISDTSDTGNLKKALVSDFGGGITWSTPINSSITVDTDSTYDIGTTSVCHRNIYSDNLYVGDSIIHNQNTNTSIDFQTNQFTITPGGVNAMVIASDHITINEGGANYDVRIEGDTDINLLFVDASNDQVGIGTNTTSEKLTVNGNIAVSGTVDGHDIDSEMTANNAKVTNATHTGEITGSTTLTADKTLISNKTLVTAASTDHVLIGDASDSDNLKKCLVSDLTGTSTDTAAIHDNVASEISAITEKTTPVSADLIIIEDSADSNNKKKVQIGNLPSGGGGAAATFERTFTGNVSTGALVPIMIPDELAGLDIKEVRLALTGLPTGQALKVDVRKSGTATTDSIFTSDVEIEVATTQTATNGLYMTGCSTAGSTVGTAGTTIDAARDTLAADDVLFIYVTQVGSTLSGADLVVTISVA